MHVSAAVSSDWWQTHKVGDSTRGQTRTVTEQGDSEHVRAALLHDKPAVCAFLTWWLLAWMLRGALILQIQADRNEEEKEKGRLFSEKQAYPLMGPVK